MRETHLVARLLLMIGIICAVIAQFIGLKANLALQDDVHYMKDLQQRLYKQTVIALESQNFPGTFNQSNLSRELPEPPNGLRSELSKKRRERAEKRRMRGILRAKSPQNKARVEWRKLNIQNVISKESLVPLNDDGQIDWNQIDHVYYYHTRKAG